MARVLFGEELWKAIRRAAKRSRRLDAAVAFIGKHPLEVIRWPARTKLVTALSVERVASGATSAKGVRKLAQAGAKIRSFAALHAKIYVFDAVAFVGSANASESSTRLSEAAVVLSKPSEVKAARAVVERLWRDASPVDDRLIAQLAKLEPKRLRLDGGPASRPTSTGSGRARRMAFLDGHGVWLSAVESEDVERAVERAREKTEAALVHDGDVDDADHVEWTTLSRSAFKLIPEQDWIFVWWKPTTRSPHGRLEGPLRCLGGFDLGKALGRGRYSRAEHPIRRRDLRLDGPAVRVLSKLISRGRIGGSTAHAKDLHDRVGTRGDVLLRSDGQVRSLTALVKRLSSR